MNVTIWNFVKGLKRSLNIHSHIIGNETRDVAELECSLMVQWVVGSIPYGGLIERFLIPTSAPQQDVVYTTCLWDGAYKRPLAVNRKEWPMKFTLSCCLSGSLPHV